MMKKKIMIVLTVGQILCSLSGCSKSAPTGEMVNNKETVGEQDEIFEIPVGSSFVENEEQYAKKTFPTLAQLREEVKEELGEHYWPEVLISEEKLERETGITRNMYIEFLAEEPSMEANVDKMIIIHAKEDYVGAVEQALEDYRLKMIEENQKYPQNLCKVEASRMETIENYICFVQLGADTSIV
ncbi:MAG: DUF4358 domain-containing protein, partial [Lachnospiraceae bacterium]|nr:DUF4358 domain-containing protein [Lachnospiraceae bacterium]